MKNLKHATIGARSDNTSYQEKLDAELRIYKDMIDINDLPPIFHYWSNKYLRPMLNEIGVANPDEFFAKYLHASAQAVGDKNPVFVSIGAGNCDTEVRVAKLLKAAGLADFTIECLDITPDMLARGQDFAKREQVSEHIVAARGDFNSWRATQSYTGIMANQSLHHVLGLETLFDEVRRVLKPSGHFVISDIIGRNGHQRWPEALVELHRFWKELPAAYRRNRQLDRHEEMYQNWDCSLEGFEGIRAQDILPLLIERFEFDVFVGFANIVDIFTDRGFGHNFDPEKEWDRDFIDRVHAFDEEALRQGKLTPTHMMAVLSAHAPQPFYSRDLRPTRCVRKESAA